MDGLKGWGIRVVKESSAPNSKAQLQELEEMLRLGHLLCEKCELKKAEEIYLRALKLAKKSHQFKAVMEALSGLLRLADEALNKTVIQQIEKELDELIQKHPEEVPATAWYCKGIIAAGRTQYPLAQRLFHRFLRMVRSKKKPQYFGALTSSEELEAKGWVNLAVTLAYRGYFRRAELLASAVLSRVEHKDLKGINGALYFHFGRLEERKRNWEAALTWIQKAHGSFLKERNWYSHLHVLMAYARIARMQQHYSQSYWYLDLLEKAASTPGFEGLRKQIALERNRLEQDAVDLLIDGRQGVVKTRENSQISLRKQYVLLGILEALTEAHARDGADSERALSKAEIIESVWKESYRPEIHDNKLYYNINRLRKLLEPDLKRPQYLLNWKEGYRLAPGLRVRFVGLKKPVSGSNGAREGDFYDTKNTGFPNIRKP